MNEDAEGGGCDDSAEEKGCAEPAG